MVNMEDDVIAITLAVANVTATCSTGKADVSSVIGLPGPIFTVIHVGALTSLSLTVLVSSVLLAYLCACRKSAERLVDYSKRVRTTFRRHPLDQSCTVENITNQSFEGNSDEENQSTRRDNDSSTICKRPASSDVSSVAAVQQNGGHSFHTKNVGERLVVYLAASDLLFGISHILDHAYMLATKDHPPDSICAPMAFLLVATTLSQWLVVLFTAVSACSLIVFGKKLNLGRRDWRLLVGTFGLALGIAGLSWASDVLGPGGAWCYFDYRSERGQYASRILSLAQLAVFAVVTFAYGTIWMKIRRTARLVASDNTRYRNSARVMLIFIAAFILQWWPVTAFYTWSMFSLPPSSMFVAVVLIVNLGGVYNCIAYTVIRRRIRLHKASRGTQVIYRFNSSKKPYVEDVISSSHRSDGHSTPRP